MILTDKEIRDFEGKVLNHQASNHCGQKEKEKKRIDFVREISTATRLRIFNTNDLKPVLPYEAET